MRPDDEEDGLPPTVWVPALLAVVGTLLAIFGIVLA